MDEILTSLKVGVIIGSATDESCCSGVCFGSDGMPEKNVASGRDTLSFFFGVFFLVVPRTRPSVVLRQRRESHHGYVGWHPCFCEAGPFFFFTKAPSMCHIQNQHRPCGRGLAIRKRGNKPTARTPLQGIDDLESQPWFGSSEHDKTSPFQTVSQIWKGCRFPTPRHLQSSPMNVGATWVWSPVALEHGHQGGVNRELGSVEQWQARQNLQSTVVQHVGASQIHALHLHIQRDSGAKWRTGDSHAAQKCRTTPRMTRSLRT